MEKASADYQLRKFVSPEIVFGLGARNLAGQFASNLGLKRILLVTDPGVVEAGWTAQIANRLEESGIDYRIFSNCTTNPKDYEIEEGLEVFKDFNADSLISIGGGSPIDCAKGIAILSSNPGKIESFEGSDKIKHSIPPLICIPTTAGSSADVSQFAIISNTKTHYKMAIVSKALVPDIALVDPETTLTMDPQLTEETGIDALTHAIEAYVSRAHSSMTDIYALEAIKLTHKSLIHSIKNPKNIEYRIDMMKASMYAGLAFSNAILGAIHAISHSIGGLIDAPHGECNALLIPGVIDFNFSACPHRYREISKLLDIPVINDDEKDKNQLVQGLNNFFKRSKSFTTLKKLGLKRDQFNTVAKKALEDPCMSTNPREMKKEDIINILSKIY